MTNRTASACPSNVRLNMPSRSPTSESAPAGNQEKEEGGDECRGDPAEWVRRVQHTLG